MDVAADYGIGVWRNDVLVAWRGQTHAQTVDRVRWVLSRVYNEQSTKVGLLQYVFEEAELPFDKEVRESLVRMFAEARRCVACSCVVAPGTGFRQAAGRAIVTGVVMLARPGFSHVVFPTLEEAAEWQARLLPRTLLASVSATEIVGRSNSLLREIERKQPAQSMRRPTS